MRVRDSSKTRALNGFVKEMSELVAGMSLLRLLQ
jgi:hypothetical protein